MLGLTLYSVLADVAISLSQALAKKELVRGFLPMILGR